MSIATYIHDIRRLTALSKGTDGAPLQIECRDAHGRLAAGLTIFLGDPALASTLADAINAATKAHDERRELIETLEAVGHDLAADGDWRGTMTDAELREAVAAVEAGAA